MLGYLFNRSGATILPGRAVYGEAEKVVVKEWVGAGAIVDDTMGLSSLPQPTVMRPGETIPASGYLSGTLGAKPVTGAWGGPMVCTMDAERDSDVDGSTSMLLGSVTIPSGATGTTAWKAAKTALGEALRANRTLRIRTDVALAVGQTLRVSYDIKRVALCSSLTGGPAKLTGITINEAPNGEWCVLETGPEAWVAIHDDADIQPGDPLVVVTGSVARHFQAGDSAIMRLGYALSEARGANHGGVDSAVFARLAPEWIS